MHTMNTPNPSNFPEPPSFDFVMKKLRPVLLDRIQEAVAEGALHVVEYKTWQAEAIIDFALAPNLVRHKAKQYLTVRGQETKDEEEADKAAFKTEDVPNNGLCTKTPGFIVRILKSSEDGNVPPPGVSVTRQNFYKQDQALLDFPDRRNGNERVQPTWNLIVHWTVDSGYNLLKVSVALPIDFTKSENGKLEVQCKFDEPFWIKPPQSGVRSISDAPVQPLASNDLDIQEDANEKTGEEQKDE
jgi:hypothetical protein